MSEDVAFEIDGKPYPYPGIVGLTMREARIFKEETGIVYESLWLDDLSVRDLFVMDGFLEAMARIAYSREHPETLDDDVKAVIDRQSRMSLFATVAQAFQPDEPASEEGKAQGDAANSSSPMRNEPGSTPSSATSTPGTSGNGSMPSSDQQENQPEPTGTGESATPFMSPPLKRVI